MTSPAELANQVWEALTELYGETDVRFNSRSHLDSGLAALSVLETRLERAEKACREVYVAADELTTPGVVTHGADEHVRGLRMTKAVERCGEIAGLLARGVVGETSGGETRG